MILLQSIRNGANPLRATLHRGGTNEKQQKTE